MDRLIAIGCAFAIGLVFAFGFYLFWKGARNVQRALASASWPKTGGLVTGSESSEDIERNQQTGASSVMYSTKTSVRYQVDGRDYSTTLIHFGQTFGSGDASEAALERVRYPAGAGVSVSYDPHDPSIAAVKPGLHADAFWLPGAGLAFLLPAAMAAVVFSTLLQSVSGQSGSSDASNSAFAVVAGIFGAIFCAGGMVMLSSGLLRIWQGHASQSWPTTTGQVVFAKLAVSDAGSNSSDGERTQTFSPQFVYEYEVNGVKHFNNIRRFGRIEGQGESWARDLMRRYPKGGTALVSYFPADPDVATLETGNDQDALWLPGIGLVALLFGLAVFIFVVPSIGSA